MQFTKNQENVSNSQRTDDKQMLEDDADVGTIKAFKAAIIIMLHDRKENTGNEGIISRKIEIIKKNKLILKLKSNK